MAFRPQIASHADALHFFRNAGDLLDVLERGEVRTRASVFNNIVRDGQALLARGLGGKNMFSMFAADLIAQHGAFDLRLFRHIDDRRCAERDANRTHHAAR